VVVVVVTVGRGGAGRCDLGIMKKATPALIDSH